MAIKEILRKIRQQKISISLDGANLKISSHTSEISPALLQEIRDRKTEIIKYLKQNQNSQLSESLRISRIDNADNYALSSSQQRLWFLSQFDGGNQAYHISEIWVIKGDINVHSLELAFQTLIERHEVLRTVFKEDAEGEIRQWVQPVDTFKFSLNRIDRREGEGIENISSRVKDIVMQPLALEEGPLFKAGLAQINQKEHLLYYVMHHIVCDGWSLGVFYYELIVLYNTYCQGKKNPLPPLQFQYKDYSAWQQDQRFSSTYQKQREYWRNMFSGELPILNMPLDKSRPLIKTFKGATVNKEIAGRLVSQFKNLIQEERATLFMGLTALVKILIYRYTNQSDIIIGTPVANRQHSTFEEQIGLYVNTLALRTKFSGTDTFRSLLKEIKRTTLEAYEHQAFPFDDLVTELAVERDASRQPLFDVMIVLQNTILNEATTFGRGFEGLQANRYNELNDLSSKFDLSFEFNESKDLIDIRIRYNADIYFTDTIERLVNHLEQLILRIIDTTDSPIDKLNYLSEKERAQLLFDFNATGVSYEWDKTVVELIEGQAASRPDEIAIIFKEEEISYRELNTRSNQFAHYLRGRGVREESLVPICIERGLEMIVGILGIMKAGGAYVPIDPDYPDERISYILNDTGSDLAVIKTKDAGRIEKLMPGVGIVDLEGDYERISECSTASERRSSGKSLAYVIYTSGSTGKPKGVMVEHRSLVNLILYQSEFFGVVRDDRILQFSNFCFDASVEQFFLALVTGAKLVLLPGHLQYDVPGFERFIHEQGITHLHATPSFLEQIRTGSYNALRRVVSGGEACKQDLSVRWKDHVRFFNKYGPTETTITATEYEVKSTDVDVVRIGRPVGNGSVYIVDKCGNPQPVSVAGELCIGGALVTRGYLNRPELTAQRFVENPFGEKGGRMYKTGDLARWLPDGNIEYLGRTDDQVKIRGYRIELGEVENALVNIQGVRQACVIAKRRKAGAETDRYLVGYYIPNGIQDELTSTHLLRELSKVLPEYMVPAGLIAMESFPLTANGKLDRGSFPDPDFSSDDYVAPRTEVEMAMVNIWQEVLGIDRVGITDDFFKIGGNSILAIQTSHRMSKALVADVRVADIFKSRTISRLVSLTSGGSLGTIPRSNAKTSVLSFAQERLWFIEQYEEGSNAYHIPSVFEVDTNTDIDGLKHALMQVVSRHEVLRSVIVIGDNQEAMQVLQEEPLLIEEIDLKHEDSLELLIRSDINRPFDLSSEYPVRAKFYRVQLKGWEKDHSLQRIILLVNIHHIASDGWSNGVFQNELLACYEAYVNGDISISLPELKIQYRDYAVWQRSYLTGGLLETQLRYWKEKLSDYQALAFPTDYVRPRQVDYSGSSQVFSFTCETSEKLRTLSKHYGVTLYSVLLSSVNILLSKYTGQDDIVVGGVTANRHHYQTEGLIGLFVNTQVNRTQLSQSQSYEELIREVYQDLIAAQLHQDLPFEKLVDELGVERDISRHPLFQIMFGMYGFGGSNTTANESKKSYLKPYPIPAGYGVEKFDLSIFIDDSQEQLQGQISYATSLFNHNTIARLIGHYKYLVDQLVAFANRPYSEISLLNPEEYDKIVYGWNATDNEYPRDKSIHQMFQEQVDRTPDNIALVFEGQQLSHKELNERSNQLARHLRKQYKLRTGEKLQPDTLIALCMERSLEMVVAILGVLKAGGAYVPIDPGYPQDRIDHLIADTRAELVLSHKPLSESTVFKLPQEKVVYVDLSLYEYEDISNLPQHGTATNLAYVIYTSGSTGKPKGVMVEHSGVVNLLVHLLNKYNIEPSERYLLFSNYIFDASIEQIFLPLFSSGTLFIVDNKTILDRNYFTSFVMNNRITQLDATPSYLSVFDPLTLKTVKRVVFGGEYLPEDLYYRYRNICTVINGYGPTEASITSHLSINSYLLNNVGIQNVKSYVLDKSKNNLPIGAVGELYIAGAGLARGYLNDSSLTSERFIPNPFATESDKAKGYNRLYKTGDLVRWTEDGNLEFRGRNDDQVKLRGYRIELGEIEQALIGIEGIQQACVLAREKQTNTGVVKYLVGYFVTETDFEELSTELVAENLSKVLPDYMIPSVLLQIDAFPLTINGKLDKRALPDLDFKLQKEYIPPRTDKERVLVKIWEEALRLERVGVGDNFFHMGGNSILAIKVAHRMTIALGYDFRVSELFRLKSIDKIISAEQRTKSNLAYPYQTIYSPDRPNILFIPTVFAGSEIYQDLAESLSINYNCIGFDNHNIHHSKKIVSLSELASNYIAQYEKEYEFREPIYLLGWSLGGQVSMEMAKILELRGYKKIFVILLDTVITQGEEKIKNENFEPVRKTVSTLEAETLLANSVLRGKLFKTNVVLFRATIGKEISDIHAHFGSAKNNIDSVAKKLVVVDLECNHFDIMKTKKQNIVEFLCKLVN